MGTSKNWPWRGLGPHPLQLLQWVSLVSLRGTRIFRGALIKNIFAISTASTFLVFQQPAQAQSYQQIRQLGKMIGKSVIEGASNKAGQLVMVQLWAVYVNGQPQTVRVCTPYNYAGQPYVC